MSIGTIIVLVLLLVALFFLGRSALAELILIFDKDRLYSGRVKRFIATARSDNGPTIFKSLSSDDLEWLQKHGTIRVGYLDDYLAYCDKDDASGELTGALREF